MTDWKPPLPDTPRAMERGLTKAMVRERNILQCAGCGARPWDPGWEWCDAWSGYADGHIAPGEQLPCGPVVTRPAFERIDSLKRVVLAASMEHGPGPDMEPECPICEALADFVGEMPEEVCVAG